MLPAYEVTTVENFKGPLEALLNLIEARKLDIQTVSMAEVTEDFIKYLDTSIRSALQTEADAGSPMRQAELRLLADFLVVAARLVLLKSRGLIPEESLTPSEEADIRDLEARLRFYRAIRPGIKILGERWRTAPALFGRGYMLGFQKLFMLYRTEHGIEKTYPGKSFSTAMLASALHSLISEHREDATEAREIEEKIVSLEEEMTSILSRIREGRSDTRLSSLILSRPRRETVVVFLALLHLAHDRAINLRQDGHFSDILVEPS